MERVVQGYENSTSKELLKIKLDKIDEEQKDYMLHAEKKCRRIKSGSIPFSPDSSKWIRRAQVYRSILRFHAKRISNKITLKRAARRCGILNPLSIPLSEVRARLKVCKEKCNYFRKHGQKYRNRHLKVILKISQDKGDEQAEKRILAILQGENERAHWRRRNYVMRKSYGHSAWVVSEKTDDGDSVEYVRGEGETKGVQREM